jgi:elongation factor G
VAGENGGNRCGSHEKADEQASRGRDCIADIKQGLQFRTLNNEIVPMLCGSAFRTKANRHARRRAGLFISAGYPAINGEKENGEPGVRHEEPFAGLAFKMLIRMWVS